MKRLAITFGILMVLLALAGVLTLIAGATSSEQASSDAPENEAEVASQGSFGVASEESATVSGGSEGSVSAGSVEAVIEGSEGGSSAESTDSASDELGDDAKSDGSHVAMHSEDSSESAADEAGAALSLPHMVVQAAEDVFAQLDARVTRLAEGLVSSNSIFMNNAPLAQELAESIVLAGSNYDSGVTYIDQREIMSSGCEIVALSVAMTAEGFDASPIEIADKYLVYGTSVAHQYRGSPYSNGGGLPPCIVDAANSWLSANGGGASAYNLTGTSFEGLLQLVERGYPLVVWTTENMGDPRYTGKVEDGLQWYTSEHCVVLYGMSGDEVLVSDSLQGLVKRDKDRFAKIYEECGRKAMFVLPDARPLRSS